MSTPDPPPRATALHYAEGERAPRVLASGRGAVADTILARAREAGVPVHRDRALADALAGLAVGGEVPEELWAAVAEVLAWAYALERRAITPKG